MKLLCLFCGLPVKPICRVCPCRCVCKCKKLVEEAPRDGRLYGRRDRKWEEIKNGGGADVQADWNQEDSTQSDYVKNRPQINEIIFTGNRYLPDTPLTNLEIEELLGNQF